MQTILLALCEGVLISFLRVHHSCSTIKNYMTEVEWEEYFNGGGTL